MPTSSPAFLVVISLGNCDRHPAALAVSQPRTETAASDTVRSASVPHPRSVAGVRDDALLSPPPSAMWDVEMPCTFTFEAL
ncbi:hypothetical protein CB1_000287010 [Camelus ferus]|nr:hypothetical protein CB1_000287010 [Camelus ferus]